MLRLVFLIYASISVQSTVLRFGGCMKECRIGDVVRLKSGGPMMTVNGYVNGKPLCCWFVQGQVVSAGFSPDALFSEGEVKAQESAKQPSVGVA